MTKRYIPKPNKVHKVKGSVPSYQYKPAETAPLSPQGRKMQKAFIGSNTGDDRLIPVWVSLDERLVYPIKSK